MTGIFAAVTALTAAMLAGCGASGMSYYLYSDLSPQFAQVVLVEWPTPQNGQASGTIKEVDDIAESPEGRQISFISGPVTVGISGNQLTLMQPFDDPIFFGDANQGVLSGSTLTVTSTDDTGPTVTLQSSNPAAYSKAVTLLRRYVAATNVNVAVSGLNADTSSLASDVSAVDSAVQQTGTDLGTEKSGAALANSNCILPSGELFSPTLDAHIVYDDSNNVAAYVATLTSDIKGVRTGIFNLNGDVATLRGLGLRPANNTQAIIGTAKKDIASAVSKANAEITTENSYLQQAYSQYNNLPAAVSQCTLVSPGTPRLLPAIPSS